MENNQYYQQPETTWNNDEPANSTAGRGQAIASLVTGILGVVCCGPCAIAALILSIVAKNQGNKSGMATAGLVLGIIGILIWIGNAIYFGLNPDAVSDITNMFS